MSYQPSHSHYEPSNEFIEKHKLEIEEAEVWCELHGEDGKTLFYNKDDGQILLHTSGLPDSDSLVFCGHLPDEQALESVIKWTNW